MDDRGGQLGLRSAVRLSGEPAERQRNAALLLSTIGAAVAGAGAGALLSELVQPVAVLVLLVGIVAHLVGMVGSRRIQRQTGYRASRWEMAAYWLCWALILLLLVVVAARHAGGLTMLFGAA